MQSGLELHMGNPAEHETQLQRHRRHASSEDAGGPLAITSIHDERVEYVGQVDVGTKASGESLYKASVVFDTGSTNLWIQSVLCDEVPVVDGIKDGYDPEASITHTLLDQHTEVTVRFGTGELNGYFAEDVLGVGPLKIPNQPFIMIKEMTGSVFHQFHFGGILGLGFPMTGVQWRFRPFFETIIEQKLLKSNEFAFYMSPLMSVPSSILWGGVNKSLYQGEIFMFPVVQAFYWELELVDLKIGGESLASISGVHRVIVDTGTTFFTAPPELHGAIVKKLPAAACKTVEESPEKYPPMTFVLRNIHGKEVELIVTQQTYMVAYGGSRAQQLCKPAWMQLQVPKEYGPAIILGEVFMRSFFTVFYRGDGSPGDARVGFATARIPEVPQTERSASLLQTESSASSTVGLYSPPGMPRMAAEDDLHHDEGMPSKLLRRERRRRQHLHMSPEVEGDD